MKKVICFGTFDRLHPGHLSFFQQAKKYGNYLIIVVARDKNVLKNKLRLPKENEKMRLKQVKLSGLGDKVVLGGLKNQYQVIEKNLPDIICLGYDQKVDLIELKKRFSGKIVRLKAFRPNIYKSSKI